MNREGGNILIIVVGVILIFFLIGFFRQDRSFFDTINFKELLRLPCGITVNHPSSKNGEKISFPFLVDGYANGCGWNVASGSAGTVQVFDGNGTPLTMPVPLTVPSDATESPYPFSADLKLIAPPRSDSGNMLLTSTTGLIYSIPVAF